MYSVSSPSDVIEKGCSVGVPRKNPCRCRNSYCVYVPPYSKGRRIVKLNPTPTFFYVFNEKRGGRITEPLVGPTGFTLGLALTPEPKGLLISPV